MQREDALRILKAVTVLLYDSIEHGTLPLETYPDLILLLLFLEDVIME